MTSLLAIIRAHHTSSDLGRLSLSVCIRCVLSGAEPLGEARLEGCPVQ
jgi:hypothetical protein